MVTGKVSFPQDGRVCVLLLGQAIMRQVRTSGGDGKPEHCSLATVT